MQSFAPWLKSFLVDTAETFGANTTTIPLHDKGKRGQIIEFLRVGTENEDAVWAILSDKILSIPIKFSKEAVVEYNRKYGNISDGKTALVTIKKFKVVSTRVPVPHCKGMSGNAVLALHCDFVSLVGRLDETKGNPRPVESDLELKEWSEGLTKDGGAGNVLKERKKVRVPTPPAKQSATPRKTAAVESRPQASSRPVNPFHEYQRRWKDSIQDPLALVRPEPKPEPKPRARTPQWEDARDLGSSSPSEKYSVPSSPISNWEPTPEKPSRKRKSPSKSPSPSDRSSTRSSSSSPEPEPSSYVSAPTPAQRRVRVVTPPLPFVRKVAPPPTPPPVGSGPERVLAPNSDQGSQPSQLSQGDVDVLKIAPARVKEEDVEMLDQDDEQTAIEIFKSPCWPEPPRKRRKVDVMATGLGLFDCVSGRNKAVVTWPRIYDVLRGL